MINKKIKSTLLIGSSILMATSTLQANSDGEALFKSKCMACHSMSRPTDMNKIVAPAIMGVMRHIKMTYPNKSEAVVFMKDYVLNPSKEKSLCMPQKLQRFGVMPSQKGLVTQEELDVILPWIFDNFPPKGFRGGGRFQ